MTHSYRGAVTTALLTLLLPLGACAQDDELMASEAEASRARAEADSLRQAILSYATFAGFAEGPCAPGDIRTYDNDSANVVPGLLRRLEALVMSHGVGVSLDTDDGRGVLRALARIETGGPGPRWDVLSGSGPRAFNPILPTQMHNPVTNECQDTPGTVPFALVLPEVTGFEPPKDSGATPYIVEHGPDGVRRSRDAFASLHVQNPNAVLRHTRVNAHALWGDYALISVIRDAEDRGIIEMPNMRTGAAYIFRRTDGEWRLLALVRNW